MNNLLYTIALVLLIVWAISFFGFNTGGLVHLSLVVALVAVVARLIQGPQRN